MKWKVSEKPTGRYRSFEKRAWPYAYYDDGAIAGMIRCSDSYDPARIKAGEVFTLELWVAVHNEHSFDWRRFKRTFSTVDECKEALASFIYHNPSISRGHK